MARERKTMGTMEAAERWDVSDELVRQWIRDRRIPARAVRDASGRVRAWLIPITAQRPRPIKPGRKPTARQ